MGTQYLIQRKGGQIYLYCTPTHPPRRSLPRHVVSRGRPLVSLDSGSSPEWWTGGMRRNCDRVVPITPYPWLTYCASGYAIMLALNHSIELLI